MDASTSRRSSAGPSARTIEHTWLGITLITLGVGLIANSLLGPLVADAIRYPLSESVLNQTIGLEAVSLFLVAPLCIVAGILVLRGRAAGPVVAFGPAAYTTYMFLQYVVGPEYLYYPGVLPLHLGLFILGGGIALAAWSSIDRERLPQMSRRSERRDGILLLALAAFIVSRYLPGLFAGLRGDPLPAEFRADASMYWSIVFLDLGIVVPATIAAALALIRGTNWGRKALYVVLGWFALVPPSVAAMAIVMVAKDDPNGSTGQAIVLTAVALLFAALAVRLYRPLFAREQYQAGGGMRRQSFPAEKVRTSDPVDVAARPSFEEVRKDDATEDRPWDSRCAERAAAIRAMIMIQRSTSTNVRLFQMAEDAAFQFQCPPGGPPRGWHQVRARSPGDNLAHSFGIPRRMTSARTTASLWSRSRAE